jgi:hypothetical protein
LIAPKTGQMLQKCRQNQRPKLQRKYRWRIQRTYGTEVIVFTNCKPEQAGSSCCTWFRKWLVAKAL